MKRILAFAGMIAIAALGLAAAVWDGSAVAGGLGDFPDDGLYGACNSFPRDTSVTLYNLENGKTVTVTITRNVDNPGVFIALSPKAAAALGMQVGTSARIRAVALTASQATTTLPPARAGETADPDYNPKVFVDREKAALASQPAESAAVTGAAASESAAAAAGTAAAAEAAASGSAAAVAESAAPEVIAGAAPEASPAEAPAVAAPEPQPPSETPPEAAVEDLARPAEAVATATEGSALAEPSPAPAEVPDSSLSKRTTPVEAELSATPLAAPEVSSPATAPEEKAEPSPEPEALALDKPTQAEKGKELSVEDAVAPVDKGAAALDETKPAAPSTEEVVTLEPAAPKPPESAPPAAASAAPSAPAVAAAPEQAEPAPAPVAAPSETEAPVEAAPLAESAPSAAPEPAAAAAAPSPGVKIPASVPLITELKKGSYYVQIGVYGTNTALLGAVAGFKAYPLAVESVTTKKGDSAFRLYVGPLSRDESGVMLMRIRAAGFKDAFLRTGT
jgi:Chemotaxis protein histidine kinase and related kinases